MANAIANRPTGSGRRRPAALCLTSALALLVGAWPALAQTAESDPPALVGRLVLISGLASERQTGDQSWTQAQSNMPMLAGSSVWTQPGAKAEIEVGGARIWLDGGTQVDIVRLDDHQVQLNLPQGRADVHLSGTRPDDSYVVNTPSGSAVLTGDGLYRIVAGNDHGPAQLAVLAGQGRFATSSANQAVDAGGEITVQGNPPELNTDAAQQDDFDRWTEGREQSIAAPVSARFVPPGVTGYEDLDQHGQWRDVPEYGNVWVPTDAPADWAPYHQGHWQWVQPWGWTWVDQQPWGFAPSHYGRWVQTGGWWAWAPGPIADRPAYAPALVSFIDDPDGVVDDPSGASVGWVPLGPGEIYTPSWLGIGLAAGVSFALFERYNWGVPHDRIAPYGHERFIDGAAFDRYRRPDVHYVNQRFVTVVNRNTFIDARPVEGGALHVQPNARIQAAGFHAGGIPNRPSEAGRFGPSGQPGHAPPQSHLAAPHLAAGLHQQARPFGAAPHGPAPAGHEPVAAHAPGSHVQGVPAPHEAPHPQEVHHQAPVSQPRVEHAEPTHAPAPVEQQRPQSRQEAPHQAAPHQEAPHQEAPRHEEQHAQQRPPEEHHEQHGGGGGSEEQHRKP